MKKYCISLIPPLLCGTTSLYFATAFPFTQTDEQQKKLAICCICFFIGLLVAYLKKTSEKKVSTENHSSLITLIFSSLSLIVTALFASTLAAIMDSELLPLPAVAVLGLLSTIIPILIFIVINGKRNWKESIVIFIEIGIEYLGLPLLIACFVFYKLGSAGEAYFYGMKFFTVFFMIILGFFVSTIDILSYSSFEGVVTRIRSFIFS